MVNRKTLRIAGYGLTATIGITICSVLFTAITMAGFSGWFLAIALIGFVLIYPLAIATFVIFIVGLCQQN